MYRRKKWLSALAAVFTAILTLFIAAGIGIAIGHSDSHLSAYRVTGWALAAALFGMFVGLSEIISRYRDEPLLASATKAGISYLILNGLISLAAFMVLQMYPGKVFSGLTDDLFMTAVVAGFGAMMVFRSKLFTFRSPDGKDYSIGPAIVLETVLRTIDAKIDRKRATQRQIEVFDAMKGLTDFENSASYIEASLLSFQNLSPDDRAEIAKVIKEYREASKWPEALKILGLGFAFLNLAGDANFDVVIANLKQYLETQKPTSGGTQQPVTTPPASSSSTPGQANP